MQPCLANINAPLNNLANINETVLPILMQPLNSLANINAPPNSLAYINAPSEQSC